MGRMQGSPPLMKMSIHWEHLLYVSASCPSVLSLKTSSTDVKWWQGGSNQPLCLIPVLRIRIRAACSYESYDQEEKKHRAMGKHTVR